MGGETMKKLFDKKSLFIRTAVGFVLGVLLGFAAPQFSIATKVAGDIYLNLIKMMILPIVICAVFCGIANIRDGALLRRIGVRTVALYVVMFAASSVVSLVIAGMIRDKRKGKSVTCGGCSGCSGNCARCKAVHAAKIAEARRARAKS